MTHDDGWRPKLVALDIDGTLLKWVEGVGTTYEQISPAVYAAVHRALDAGVHVVLASGRSPHGMTNVADLLDLHGDGERLWVVASNGAVVFRYPPLEVVHEVTFDAAPAVRAVLQEHPSALVAVEERGVGYRVNRPFPPGELSGEFTIADVADLVAVPVSRVIIRDPDATADDFVALGERLGLQGTDYVVGWTAWLDLAPVGVSKASGLEYVARELGIDAPDVLAIGDGRNDIEMLQWVGRGVAMGQSIDVVKEAADAVTATVYDEGAAQELERYWPAGMSLPRLVATDLDGTLLDDDGILSERSQDVLRRVQELGVRVVIVTARPLRWMDELWARVGGGRGVGIVSNGAITYDIGSREVLDHHGIPPEVGLPMVEAIRAAAPGTAIALECLGGFRHEPAYVDMHPTPPDMRVGDLAEIWDEPAVKVLAQHLTLDPADFRARVIDAVGERGDADLDHRSPDGDQRGRRHQGRRPGGAVRAARRGCR